MSYINWSVLDQLDYEQIQNLKVSHGLTSQILYSRRNSKIA